MSHVMRPIHVQKWSLGPTHHTHKMYILYKNDLITTVFDYNLYKIGSLAQNFTKNTRESRFGQFFSSKAPDASHPQVRLRYLKGVPRRGKQCPIVEFPYLGYFPPKCNAMAYQHSTHANISLMHILTKLIP